MTPPLRRIFAWTVAVLPAAVVVTLIASTASPAPAEPAPDPSASAPQTLSIGLLDVDGRRAMDHLSFFAAREQGGRYSGSVGYENAATYAAARLAEIGIEPWGDGGTYFQRFTMPIVDLAATPLLARTFPDAKTYRHRVEFSERIGLTFGGGDTEGPLVHIGAGLPAELDAVDVRGKVALVLGGGPDDPARELAARGAAAAIYVRGATLLKFSPIARFESTTIPAIVVPPHVADDLLLPANRRVSTLTGRPATDLGLRVRVSVPLTPLRDAQAINVVGVLRAGDPENAKRAVLVGGHLDGVGVDPDGTLFPGANDNASGVALTIEVARTLAARRGELRHSIVFVAFGGHEEGLFGSEAFATQFAALPGRRESLLGYVNLDATGCCGRTISASIESDEMVARVRRAAQLVGVAFEPGGRGGSDHQSFARYGVPATLLKWADVTGIHSTSDTIDRVTAGQLTTIGRVAVLVVLEIAGSG